MYIQKKRIVANEDLVDESVVENEPEVDEEVVPDDAGEVTVDPEATDLLFEAEDVAELIAEVTGQEVEVSVEDDLVEFAIGEDVYTVEAEGDEELLEASTKKVFKGKKSVAASTQKRVAATTARSAAGRTVRKPATRRK